MPASAVLSKTKESSAQPNKLQEILQQLREEIDDLTRPLDAVDLTPYRRELDALWTQHGRKINCLITEPYLGGGGSFHPPAAYLQLLQSWCREHDIVFILDEVQSNFGRTGQMYAYEKYGIEPDIVAGARSGCRSRWAPWRA